MTRNTVDVGIELGGTKIVVGASDRDTHLVSREVIATSEPIATLSSVHRSVERVMDLHRVQAIGIASFGPIDLQSDSPGFGTMLATPKAGWAGVDVLGMLAVEGVAIAIDTDVAAALLAERMWGVGTRENVAYLTVGTGIGGAIWSSGGILRGANHSEMGHMRVPRHPDDDFPGNCPFHGDCLEGMASGTALHERWGVTPDQLRSDSSEALTIEAWYLAHAIASLCAVLPMDQVIIGGGVSKMPGFHTAISAMLPQASGGYPTVPFATGGPEVLPPGLGDNAGVIGAIEFARAVSTA